MYKQDIRIEHVNNGGIMDLASEAVEGFVGGAAPKGNVVDSHAALEQWIGKPHLAERLDSFRLQAVRSVQSVR